MTDAETHAEVCIVGAGAAGLWAAAACRRRGLDVLVLEKTGRTGTKVLASGGTRCNLTTTLDHRDAARLFGTEGARFVSAAFKALPPSAVRQRFHDMGVPTKVEPALQKVFPASDSARQVRDALEQEARRLGVRIEVQRAVTGIEPGAGSAWTVHTGRGPVHCRALLLCPGGQSYPKSGTTGDGYGWLRALDLEVVTPVPALVALDSSARWIHRLSGVSLDVEARVGSHRRRRPVLFTHTGLSGPAAMDLSIHIARATAPTPLLLDLLPDQSFEAIRATLVAAAQQAGSPRLASVLPLPRRVVEMVSGRLELGEPNPVVQTLDKSRRHRLVTALKGLEVPISGTQGFDKAEVTAGGLALGEVDRKTMEVRSQPGLFVFGEILDLQGPIGGLNFQAAFATAERAAHGVSRL